MIHNAVDVAALARAAPVHPGVPPGARVIVQVANVMPDKDYGTLLRAAAALGRRRNDFRLLLAGRGTDSPEMAEAIRSARAAEVVTPLGRQENVAGLLRAADLFVLSTHSEVFNVATLEALAAGTPAIVSDIPAFEEMFDHAREGWKVPPGDPEALAEAMGRMLDDAELRQRLIQGGRSRVQEFSRERMAEKFRALLAGRPRRPRGLRRCARANPTD